MPISYLIWGGWLLAFAVLELVAVFWSGCPWKTLSTTAWSLERYPGVPIVFLAGLAVLLVHIVFKWPRKNEYDTPPSDTTRSREQHP